MMTVTDSIYTKLLSRYSNPFSILPYLERELNNGEKNYVFHLPLTGGIYLKLMVKTNYSNFFS